MYRELDQWLSGPGVVGWIWAKIKAFFSWIAKQIGKVFDTIASWIKKFFSKDFWKDVKTFLGFMVRPFSNIVYIFKHLGTWIDNYLSDLPLIGRIYKGLKKFTGQVSAGTFAESIDKTLRTKAPEELRTMKEIRGAENLPTTKEMIVASEARRAAAERKMKEMSDKKQTEELKKALEETSGKSAKAIISSNSSLITTNNNNANVNAGGGGMMFGGGSFTAADKYAENVTKANT